jgi:hypothetical protein
MVFNGAIDHIIQNNSKARQNPRGLSQLDGYKRGLVNSLTGNLQKFGLDRVPRVKTLDELLQDDETNENPTQDCAETMNQAEEKSLTVLSSSYRLVEGMKAVRPASTGASEPETPITQCRRRAQRTITRSF